MSADPYAQLKAVQREAWPRFSSQALFTAPPAASLVAYSGLRAGDKVLDVACGTGVVALTAARQGARVSGLDLTPALLEEARENAAIVEANIEFIEGDVEAMAYASGTFDVVLSQLGHMFAPRPEMAIAEMLRVLRPGGRIAFTTWPPEMLSGQLVNLVSTYVPPLPGPPPSSAWGDPAIVRQRLGGAIMALEFQRDEMRIPSLSPQHYRLTLERANASVVKAFSILAKEPDRLAHFRAALDGLISNYFKGNAVHLIFLMTRATKVLDD